MKWIQKRKHTDVELTTRIYVLITQLLMSVLLHLMIAFAKSRQEHGKSST